jgi:prepilin peptidase CpaA
MPQVSVVLLLLPFLGAAVITDIADRRIPNVMVAAMLAVGLLVQAATLSPGAVLWSVAGVIVGLLMLLPFYVAGGMAAGDVKLLAAAGAFLGPTATFFAGLFTLLAGAALAVGWLWGRKLYAAYLTYRQPAAVIPGSAGEIALPYSLAISAGTLLSVTQW